MHAGKSRQDDEEDAVQERIDNQGAVLTEPDMKTEAAPEYGEKLVGSFLKELETRKYEIAGTEKTDSKSTNDIPQNTKSILKPEEMLTGNPNIFNPKPQLVDEYIDDIFQHLKDIEFKF